jgi:predicted DNA-binding transcriptional regulator YafY
MQKSKDLRIAKVVMFLHANRWEPVSKRRICSHLGISERTLYRYISSKLLYAQINNGFVTIRNTK